MISPSGFSAVDVLTCETCGQEKPIAKFDKMVSGHRKKCRSCRAKATYARRAALTRTADWEKRQANKDKKRAYDRRRYAAIKADPALYERRKAMVRKAAKSYYWRDPQRGRDATKKWMKNNPDKRAAQKRRYRQRHLKRVVKQIRAYHIVNGLQITKKVAERYRRDQPKRIMACRDWARNNPEKLSQYQNTRRARKLQQEQTHSLAEWKALVAAHNHKCFYCGKRTDRLTRDHKKPLFSGGSDAISNIVPACRPCNSAKARMEFDEFLRKIKAA